MLQSILIANESKWRDSMPESEQLLADRSQAEMYELVVERIVVSAVVASWNMVPPPPPPPLLLEREEIEAVTFEKYPDAGTCSGIHGSTEIS